jgi:protein-S-isoprenylcysteine O-methyltransferase Ste14
MGLTSTSVVAAIYTAARWRSWSERAWEAAVRSIYTTIAYWSWIAMALVWLPGYFLTKPAARIPDRVRQRLTTLLLFAGYALLFSRRAAAIGGLTAVVTPPVAVLGQFGVALDLAGVAFAIWARITLGRNWAGIAEVKQSQELVQRGPYALVRHPIYTGLLTAMVGTALTVGRLASYLGVLAGLAGILLRVRQEDALMAEEFPAEHASYRTRTKALIPLVW